MAGFRISVATSDYRRGIKVAIPFAATSGADGVAFDLRQEVTSREFGGTAIRQLQHLVQQHGLQIAPGYFPLRRPLCDPEHADERIAAIESAMHLAHQLRAGGLVIPAGALPDVGTPDDARLLEAVDAIAAIGNRSGTIPCLNFGIQQPGRVLRLMRGVNAGPIMYDINPVDWLSQRPAESAGQKLRLAELSFGSGPGSTNESAPDTLEALIRALPESIGHVQGRDGRSMGRGSSSETAVGAGQVDWPLLIALLHEAAYAGWVTVRQESSATTVEDIAQGVAYLRSFRSI